MQVAAPTTVETTAIEASTVEILGTDVHHTTTTTINKIQTVADTSPVKETVVVDINPLLITKVKGGNLNPTIALDKAHLLPMADIPLVIKEIIAQVATIDPNPLAVAMDKAGHLRLLQLFQTPQ